MSLDLRRLRDTLRDVVAYLNGRDPEERPWKLQVAAIARLAELATLDLPKNPQRDDLPPGYLVALDAALGGDVRLLDERERRNQTAFPWPVLEDAAKICRRAFEDRPAWDGDPDLVSVITCADAALREGNWPMLVARFNPDTDPDTVEQLREIVQRVRADERAGLVVPVGAEVEVARVEFYEPSEQHTAALVREKGLRRLLRGVREFLMATGYPEGEGGFVDDIAVALAEPVE